MSAKYSSLLARRQKYLHPVHKTNYAKPMMVTKGEMQYLYDEENVRYLDLFGGVATVSIGHSHPELTKAVARQTATLTHTSTLFLTESIVDFCETLANKLPNPDDWVVHLVNSGSEANDFAALQARVATKNYVLMSLRHGYHGCTEGSRGLVSVPKWKHSIPPPPGIIRVPVPSTYRGRFGTTTADLPKYIDDMRETIACETGGNIAAFFAEPMQGYSGAVELIPGYLEEAYKVVREHGGLCVSDEVQCGFGRLGTHYWGFEMAGVDPDMVVCAKSVANGFPVGVVATKRKVAEKMTDTLYFNTFGGNAVCMEAAKTVLRVIDEDGLQENALRVGNVMLAGMRRFAEQYPFLGQVRGSGLLIAFEVVKSKECKTPEPSIALQITELMKERHVLVGKGGPYGSVVRMAPPMCMTEDDAHVFLEALGDSLKVIASEA